MTALNKLKTNELYSVKSKYIRIGGDFSCLLEIDLKKNQWQMTNDDVIYFLKTLPFLLNTKPFVIKNERIKLNEKFYDEEVRLSMVCYIKESNLDMLCTVLSAQENFDKDAFHTNFHKLVETIDKESHKSSERVRKVLYRVFTKKKVVDLLGNDHWLVNLPEMLIFHF